MPGSGFVADAGGAQLFNSVGRRTSLCEIFETVLERVAYGRAQGIAGVEMFGTVTAQIQDPVQHLAYLFFGGVAVSGNGLFDAEGRVFENPESAGHGGRDGHALGASEFDKRLRVFAVKGRFNREGVRTVTVDEAVYFGLYAVELDERIVFAA